MAVTDRRVVWPDLRRNLSQVFRLHRGTLFLCVVCCGEGFVFVSPTRVVSFHFDFWKRGSKLLSILLMMTAALLAMLTYDDDPDKDEAADDDDHHDDAYIVLFLFCSSPLFSSSSGLMSFGTCHSCRLPCLVFAWLPCFRGPSVLMCCTESEDSKMRCHTTAFLSFEFFEFVSATACVTSFPFSFSIYVTAHCRQQCLGDTPCDKCKAHLSHQILFLRGYDPHARCVRHEYEYCDVCVN